MEAAPNSDGEQAQTSPASELQAVDLHHLRRYTFGDQALEKEILALFIGQLPETIAALRSAPTAKDWKVAAHTLKGSCRAIGAFGLGDIAEAAEKLEFSPGSVPCKDVISRIEASASHACLFIRDAYGLQ